MGSVTPATAASRGAGAVAAASTDSATFPDLNDAEYSMTQWLFSEDDLQHTPSVLCGLSMKQERQNRAKGVNFILQVGILLKLPQITLATAACFLHRFFMRHSMVKDMNRSRMGTGDGSPGATQDYHYYSVAAASVWLAAKVEENCRKMIEVVKACVRVAQKDSNKVVDEQDKEYWRWRDTIIALEDKLLEGLCFDLSLESPYKALYDIICRFDAQDNKVFRNAAWAFVNDSCLMPLCVLFPSRTIAAASVYAAARSCKLEFLDEDGRPWWEIIGVPLVEIRRACNYMADVYEDAPLREGARQDLYQRTPINGDERSAKTRGVITSGGASSTGGGPITREGSVVSNTGSDASTMRKRNRDASLTRGPNGGGGGGGDGDTAASARDQDEPMPDRGQQPVSMNDMPWGGETSEERQSKRAKQEAASNGRSELQPGGHGAPDKMQVDGNSNSNGDSRGRGANKVKSHRTNSKADGTSHEKVMRGDHGGAGTIAGHGDRNGGAGDRLKMTSKGGAARNGRERYKDADGEVSDDDGGGAGGGDADGDGDEVMNESETVPAGEQVAGAVSPDLAGSEEGELDG